MDFLKKHPKPPSINSLTQELPKSKIKRHQNLILISLAVLIALSTVYVRNINPQTQTTHAPTPKPTPQTIPFQTYTPPEIETKKVYIIGLLGDSMTAALGPHGGKFTEKINKLYDNNDFLVDNYGQGSTNILSLDKRLSEPTQFNEWIYDPILERTDLDLLIIESFAYNPLSQFERDTALFKHTEALQNFMTTITNRMPNTKIIFISTIAPSEFNYAQTALGISDQESQLQSAERIEYLKNHLKFARDHNIPFINVFQLSLATDTSGIEDYINPDDLIHPSAGGIEFITSLMANFLDQTNTFPRL